MSFKKFKDWILLAKLKISTRRKNQYYITFLYLFLFLFLKFYLFKFFEKILFISVVDISISYLIIDLFFLFFKAITISRYRKKNVLSIRHTDTFTLGIRKISFLISNFLFLVFLFYYFNINIINFLKVFGLFSVAIAWIFQDKISNLISAMGIMFSEQIKLKDYIRVGDNYGVVNDVNYSNTILTTDDGDILYVPNNILVNSQVINYSKTSLKRVKFNFKLSKDYYGKVLDLEKLFQKELVKEFDEVLKKDSITLKFDKINEKSTLMNLEVFVTKYNFDIAEKVKRHSSLLLMDFIVKNQKVKNKRN